MAKYQTQLTGDFIHLLDCVHKSIIGGSASASYEDGSDFVSGSVRCAVRVYERYSMVGGNRVSMSITLLAIGSDLFLTGITSGGSQAVFFKMNTFGEEAFLDQLVGAVEKYKSGRF